MKSVTQAIVTAERSGRAALGSISQARFQLKDEEADYDRPRSPAGAIERLRVGQAEAATLSEALAAAITHLEAEIAEGEQ